jgi:hypothetical protein
MFVADHDLGRSLDRTIVNWCTSSSLHHVQQFQQIARVGGRIVVSELDLGTQFIDGPLRETTRKIHNLSIGADVGGYASATAICQYGERQPMSRSIVFMHTLPEGRRNARAPSGKDTHLASSLSASLAPLQCPCRCVTRRAEIVIGVADRVRAELLRSIGLALHLHLG